MTTRKQRRRALEVGARLAGPLSPAARRLCLEIIRDGIDSHVWMQAVAEDAAPAVKCDAQQEEQQCQKIPTPPASPSDP